jgi:GNAT superfamily N-acetyltransferase
MNVDRSEAAFWAAHLRNRNVDHASAQDGALAVAGGYALCANGTFLQYAIGAGTTRALRPDDLSVVRDFYQRRGLPPRLELAETVLARDSHVLRAAGFFEDGVAMAVFQADVNGPLEPPVLNRGLIEITTVRTAADRRGWIDVVVEAFSDTIPGDELPRLIRATELSAQAAQGLFVASLDGMRIGGGAVAIYGDLAFLFSAAVLPAYRGRGAHAALLASRLAFARTRGAIHAAFKTVPDSLPERSARRLGFARTHIRRRVRAVA